MRIIARLVLILALIFQLIGCRQGSQPSPNKTEIYTDVLNAGNKNQTNEKAPAVDSQDSKIENLKFTINSLEEYYKATEGLPPAIDMLIIHDLHKYELSLNVLLEKHKSYFRKVSRGCSEFITVFDRLHTDILHTSLKLLEDKSYETQLLGRSRLQLLVTFAYSLQMLVANRWEAGIVFDNQSDQICQLGDRQTWVKEVNFLTESIEQFSNSYLGITSLKENQQFLKKLSVYKDHRDKIENRKWWTSLVVGVVAASVLAKFGGQGALAAGEKFGMTGSSLKWLKFGGNIFSGAAGIAAANATDSVILGTTSLKPEKHIIDGQRDRVLFAVGNFVDLNFNSPAAYFELLKKIYDKQEAIAREIISQIGPQALEVIKEYGSLKEGIASLKNELQVLISTQPESANQTVRAE